MHRSLIYDMTFPGEPAVKGRPRATRTGQMYTPRETREAEAELQRQMRLFCGPPLPTPKLAVHLEFHCASNRRKDLDNCVKLVWDAANKLVWLDDSQVSELYVLLNRGVSEPHTRFLVYAPIEEQQQAA